MLKRLLDNDGGRAAKMLIGIVLLSAALSGVLPMPMTIVSMSMGFVAILVSVSGACPLLAVTRLNTIKRRVNRMLQSSNDR